MARPVCIFPKWLLSYCRAQRRSAQRTVRCNPLLVARAAVVHYDGAIEERRHRDKLEPSRAG
jgi:hypothetical protein